MNILVLYASSDRHRKREPGHVLQGLSGGVATLPLAGTARGRQQQSRLGQREREPPGQHQQGQHHQLPQPHGRRRPTHLHGDHGQGRPPQNILHEVRRNRIQTTHRKPHNHEATQRIPIGNKKNY